MKTRWIGYTYIAKEARKAETVLIDKLLDAGADVGVIGARSRGRLQRLPSTAYWAGLRKWGILQLTRSKDEYHRWLDLYYGHLHQAPTADESDDAGSIGSANWQPHIPPAPETFPDGATFDLTTEEADYLADRIRQKTSGSLLAHFVIHCRRMKYGNQFVLVTFDATSERLNHSTSQRKNLDGQFVFVCEFPNTVHFS